MKKSTLFLIIIFTVISCTKDEAPTVTPKLKNCRVEYLFFRDEITLSGYQTFNFPPNDSSLVGCSYTYKDDEMIKTTGGFVNVPLGSNFSNLMFSTKAYDSIDFEGNRIYIFTKTKFATTIVENTYDPVIFTLNTDKKLSTIFKRDAYHPDGYSYTYTYSDNLITETNFKGQVSRKFFFENNNLVKVLSQTYDFNGALYSKKEILFQEFDNKPNPFKNMYFVKGAFFRAFSENNYQKFTINEYSLLSDGTFGLNNTGWFSMPIEYNADGYPMFGDYQ
jgi:hypothetical protein